MDKRKQMNKAEDFTWLADRFIGFHHKITLGDAPQTRSTFIISDQSVAFGSSGLTDPVFALVWLTYSRHPSRLEELLKIRGPRVA